MTKQGPGNKTNNVKWILRKYNIVQNSSGIEKLPSGRNFGWRAAAALPPRARGSFTENEPQLKAPYGSSSSPPYMC